jgi:hypothetical protein
MKYPEQLRVVRARWTAAELEFLVWHTYTDDARLVVKVISPRRDAARYFRKRYGPAVKVIVLGRRYERRKIF